MPKQPYGDEETLSALTLVVLSTLVGVVSGLTLSKLNATLLTSSVFFCMLFLRTKRRADEKLKSWSTRCDDLSNRLFEFERRLRQLEKFRQQIATSDKPFATPQGREQDFFQLLVESLNETIGCERIALWYRHPKSDRLLCLGAMGTEKKDLPELPLLLDEQSASTFAPLKNFGADPLFLPLQTRSRELIGMLAISPRPAHLSLQSDKYFYDLLSDHLSYSLESWKSLADFDSSSGRQAS